ncbi:MAG TPA: Gfo/Idh/MocA family oxidoreductase [Opitutus sp.]|nr:Gfo/Idh/MocA family oxidoreductase [Opitutus sp.]
MSFSSPFSRRRFVKTLGTGALAAPLLSRSLLSAPAASGRILRHASFGAAGQAWNDIQAICSNPFVQLVAVAEVDLNRLANVITSFPGVRVYQDWRELLEREKDNIDSVNVSTPDHLHAPIAMSAMRLGKHVYCQKPLAHDLHEVRALTEFARDRKLVTQMGIQVHARRPYREAVALIRAGAIGKVREVHTWSNKKWGDAGPPPDRHDPVPAGFNWDDWLAGCADRPFIGDGYYHPETWRKRLDFGTGTFGDMGCHIFDPVFAALELTAPLSVRSEGPPPDRWNWSIDAVVHYVFPRTAHTAGDSIPITWYDGDQRPPAEIRALIAEPDPHPKPGTHDDDPWDQGSIFIGTDGVMSLPHVRTPVLFPRAKYRDYPFPKVVETHHWTDWAEECVGGPGKASAPFSYSGPLTESVLLGSIAVRFPHQTLAWDGPHLTFTNEPAANAFLRRTYREGWRVPGL